MERHSPTLSATWFVDTLVDNGNFAEDALKSERRQVIDLTALSGCGDRI
jgi:hypothetical protein